METDAPASDRQTDRRFNSGIRQTECKLDKCTGQRGSGHFRSSR